MKAEKCEFEKEEIKGLGMIIGYGKICMDLEKIKAVAEWPEPKNKKQLQKFLGFNNFYWRFIKSYSGVAKPLTKLTGNEEWKWGKEQKEAMKELKRRVCSVSETKILLRQLRSRDSVLYFGGFGVKVKR